MAERAATRYLVDGECHVSTYSVASHGYSQIGWHDEIGRTVTTAHRAAWVHYNGQIEDGMTIDHLCRNRQCVRPDHLRALSNFENARRTFGKDWPLGQCANGHPNSLLCKESSRNKLYCPECRRQYARDWARKNRDRVREYNRRYKAAKRSGGA